MTTKIVSDSARIHLRRVLGSTHLWAIGVGMVISGEYFGWNYGWNAAGTIGFLISTSFVTVLYLALALGFSELTTSIPNAGGPFIYALRAFGPLGGLIAGYATAIEFVLAPPAIAIAIGSYVNFLLPDVPVLYTAIACYFLFTIINLFGIKESAVFTGIVTLLAAMELLIFMGITLPHFHVANFMVNPMKNGWSGVVASLPFAIWFYLGIEGVSMVSEEVRDPRKNIPKAFILAIFTLILLAFGVMFCAGGVGDWQRLSNIDYPLPESISMVLGKSSSWTSVFACVGLFGLIASFHSLIIGYSRQLFALSRSGFLPMSLSRINKRFRTPHWALLLGSLVGLIALFSGKADKIITFSVLGAVVMYCSSMLSLFKLRKSINNPTTYRTPYYPWIPMIAFVFSLICLLTIVYYNILLSVIFFLGLALLIGLFFITGKNKLKFSEGDVTKSVDELF